MRVAKDLLNKVVVLLLATSMLVACGGKEERKAKYMERGKAYMAEKNYDKAKIEFKNVLQIDPKTAEAFLYLGELEEKKQKWNKAFGSYKKASELDPELLEARVKLARFYLLQGNAQKEREDKEGMANSYGLVQNEIKEVLARDPSNLDARTLQAALWQNDGEVDKAQAHLEKILQEDSGLNSAAMMLSSIYDQRSRTEDAEKVLVVAIANSADKTDLQLRLSQFYIQHKQNDKAEEVLRQVITENPEEVSYRVSLASFLAQTEQLDRAEQVLRDSIAADPEDEQRYILLASFLETKRSPQAAQDELRQAMAQNPGMTELSFGLVKLYLNEKNVDEAKKLLEGLISGQGNEPAGLKARVALAQILAAEDVNSKRARELTAEVLEENPRDNQALILKGKFAANEKDYTDAIASFRSVLKDQPNSVEVLQLLAAAHLANNEPELARDTLTRGIESNPQEIELRMSLVNLLVRQNDLDSALKQVDDVLAVDQYNEKALTAKYELLARKGDAAGMNEVTRQMQAGAPEKEEGYIRQARLRLAQKDYAAATDILEKVLEKNPDSVAALMARSEVLAAEQKYDDAIADARKIQQVSPENPEGYFREAKLLELKQEPAAALDLYEAAYTKAPDSPQVLSALVDLEVKTGNAAAAEKRLLDMIAQKQDHSSANELLGMVYLSQKDFSAAEKAFEAQIKVNPTNTRVYSQLATARVAQDDLDGAAGAFEDGLKQSDNDVRLLIGLAGVRERQKDFDGAISVYEKVLSEQPGNALSVNNVAALIADHRTDEASLAKAAEYAAILEKTSQPAFLDTAGWVYYRTGDYPKAVEVLSTVVEKAPDVPVFQYHLGMAYLKSGDETAAREHLEKATGDDAKYQGVDEAREALKSL